MLNSNVRGTFAAVTAAVLTMLLPAAAGGATISSSTATPLADNFTDDSVCSLREMVQISNLDSLIEDACTVTNLPLGNDTIQLGTGTYTLTTPVDGTPDINDGDLEVNDNAAPNNLTIVGAGSGSTFVDGGDIDRVFEIFGSTGAVTLQGATVQNGTAAGGSGGGISSGTSLTLQDARVRDNATTGSFAGGGVSQGGGTLTLNDSSVDHNVTATGPGGGITLAGDAVVTNGNTSINDNTAGNQGGAINISVGGAHDITLNSGAVVNSNHAVGVGGAIATNTGDAGSDLIADGAIINGNQVTPSIGNTATAGGIHYVGNGQLQLTDTRVQGNTVSAQTASAGGINGSVGSGTMAITRSLITQNQVTVADNVPVVTHVGGGILFSATSGGGTIADSRIGLNTMTLNDPEDFASGAGIYDAGALTILSSTLDGNSASGGLAHTGGGLQVAQTATGPANVLNSTFSGNSVGSELNSSGAGINAASVPVALTVVQSTFDGNSASAGNSLAVNGSTYTVRTSVFSDGLTACVPNTLTGVNAFNVDEGTSCVGVADDTDLESTAATLGPLQENGGPLYGGVGPALTQALTGPASALNVIPQAACEDLNAADLLVDERGAPRPIDGGCEPGAYELISCFGQPAYVGSSGNDMIDASDFDPVTNAFHGLAGADTISGDDDANQLCGGDDGDTILARDGVPDQIDCGPGTDTVQTDALGVDTLVGCETVDTPTTSTPPPTTTPPATGPTGQRARAIKKCKKKFPKGPKRKKCLRKAKRLPL